jgi:hypothetical protein
MKSFKIHHDSEKFKRCLCDIKRKYFQFRIIHASWYKSDIITLKLSNTIRNYHNKITRLSIRSKIGIDIHIVSQFQ